MPAAADGAIIPTVIREQVYFLPAFIQKPLLKGPANLSLRHLPALLVPFFRSCLLCWETRPKLQEAD